jgi:hypothetical protein
MLNQATLARLDRGLKGVAAGLIKIVSTTTGKTSDGDTVIIWEVFSTQSNKNGNTYFVGYKPVTGEWRCTCPDYGKRGKPCKHIMLAQVHYQQRVEV